MENKHINKDGMPPKGQPEIPAHLQWDKMKDGIFAKMDEIDAETDPSPPNNKPKRQWWIVGSMVLLLGLIAWYAQPTSSNATIPGMEVRPSAAQKKGRMAVDGLNEKYPLIPMSLLPVNSTTSSDPGGDSTENLSRGASGHVLLSSYSKKENEASSLDFSVSPLGIANAATLEAERLGRITSSEHEDVLTLPTTLNTEAGESRSQFGFPPRSSRETQPLRRQDATPKEQLLPGSSSTITRAAAKDNKGVVPVEEHEGSPVSLLGASPPPYLVFPSPLPALVVTPVKPLDSVPVHATPTTSISLSTGAVFWSRPDLSPQGAQEVALPSTFAQLNYRKVFAGHWTWSVGIQYQQLYSRFNWNTELDDYTVVLTDTIVRVVTNTTTGEQRFTRGDVAVETTALRRVQHYNRTQILQVPLAVGRRWQKNRWTFNASIGGALNVQTEHYGRGIDGEEVIDFSGSDNPLMNTEWGVSAMVAGQLSYPIGTYWSVNADLQYQQSITNWSKIPDQKQRPSLLQLGLGLQYSF